MRRSNVVLFAVVALVSLTGTLGAQDEIRPFNRRIVGGEKTDIKLHPWQVALNVTIDRKAYLCGGSIIGQRWVLTAAHCFSKSTTAKEVRAKAGATDYVVAGTWAEIKRVVVHEGYNSKTHQNDIALIELKTPAPGRAIAVAPRSLTVPLSQSLEVTGWGTTTENGTGSSVLLKATIPHADPTACNAPNAYNGRIKDGMMCAGYRDGGVDSCQGDSGGPLVWRTPNGPMLVGVVSWGEGCARKLKYGVYTRVSQYRDWIEMIVASDRN